MNQLPEESKSVLIVGAGPIGLTAACYLDKLGVSFDIVERRSGPVEDSRALGIHARTLEFMRMFKLDKKLISEGNITRFMSFHRHHRSLFKLDFKRISHLTRFPYMLVLPQSKTELILARHLESTGISIHWNTECGNINHTSEGVEATLTNTEVHSASKLYQYVIASDGANSSIRSQLDIDFEGDTYDARFLLSEVKIRDNAIARNSSHVFMGNSTTVAVIPQPDDVYRIVGPDFSPVMNEKSSTEKLNLNFDQFRLFLSKQNLFRNINIDFPSRLVSYRVHKRIAREFRKDRVFLAGDAAHIHSPAGGQGMNTGIHDVINLGWKLAAVLKGNAKPDLLDTYQSERQVAVKAIVNGADQAMMKVVNRSLYWRILLDFFAPVVTKWYQPSRLLASMAQLTWNYCEHRTDHTSDAIKPGTRMGDYDLTNGKTVHSVLGSTCRPLLFISGSDTRPSTQASVIASYSRSRVNSLDQIQYELIDPLMSRNFGSFIGGIVVRPDGYILANIPLNREADIVTNIQSYLTST